MDPQVQSSEPKESVFKEIVQFTLIALIIVIPIRLFIAQPFIVDGHSMDSTFDHANYLIVDELTYRFRAPERGEVVVFKFPLDQRRSFIKRVIGLPEETLYIRDGKITIVNKENPAGFVLDEAYVDPKNNIVYASTTVIMNKGEYYVMGDNRSGSSDSREWGTLDRKLIIGRPLVRLLPLNRIDLLPGNFHSYAH